MNNTTTEFFNKARQMVLDLQRVAQTNPHQWQKDAIMSPLGNLVVVEFINGANEAYKINGCAPVCTHWNNVNPMNDIMRAAGYVRK